MKVFQLLVTLITFFLCVNALPSPANKDKSKGKSKSKEISAKTCPNLIKNSSFSGKGRGAWSYHGIGASKLIGKAFANRGAQSIVFDITRTDQRPQLYQSIRGVVPDKTYAVKYHFKVLNGAPKVGDNCKIKVQVGPDTQEHDISELIHKDYRALQMKFESTTLEATLQVAVYCAASTRHGVQLAVDDIHVWEVTKDCPA